MYLALLGPLLALAVAVDALLGAVSASSRMRVAATMGGVAVCAALGLALGARATVWSTRLALWADAVEKNPSGPRAAGNSALALHEAGLRDQAIRAYQRAQVLSRTPQQFADTARNLSALYLEAGNLPAALSVLEVGLAAVRHDFELRAALANTLRQLGRLDEALAEAKWALAIAPNEPEALDALGLVLLDRGDAEQALAQFRRAVAIDSSTLAYTENALVALERLGRRGEACAAWARIQASGGTSDSAAREAAARLACGR